jgi:hypothetical protein
VVVSLFRSLYLQMSRRTNSRGLGSIKKGQDGEELTRATRVKIRSSRSRSAASLIPCSAQFCLHESSLRQLLNRL